MEYVIAVLAGYLLGSIPVALIVGRAHGVDLRSSGDGNPGAWNALEQLGARRALPVFLGDAAKAAAAGLIGLALGGWWAGWAAVAAAMIGHAFPVFAGFRGGKAVMCFVGGSLVLAPVAGGLAVALCAVVSVASRSFAWGARAGVCAFPVIQLALDPVGHVAATGALMTIIGALFGLDRLQRRSRTDPATRAAGAPPTA